MADFEDANCPTWFNMVDGQLNLRDAVRRTISFEQAGKQLIDTTCPLVRHVHEAAQRLQAQGYHVLVIGRARHVEVRGIVGDLRDYHIIETVNDVDTFGHPRLGVVCQSTTPRHFAEEILDLIRSKNPGKEVVFRNTICKPTRERQEALELAESARKRGKPAVHIQSAADLEPGWLLGFETIGLTAGTSTLPDTVEEVHRAILRIAEATQVRTGA
jgi:4-hydroxy-3-methylbut-2-enyl diphosphate reductase